MKGVHVVLCLPINNLAAWLASLPSTTSLASTTCQFLSIPCLVGKTVLIEHTTPGIFLRLLKALISIAGRRSFQLAAISFKRSAVSFYGTPIGFPLAVDGG